jgi:hypothetical protein
VEGFLKLQALVLVIVLTSCSLGERASLVNIECESAVRWSASGSTQFWLVRQKTIWSDGSQTYDSYEVKPDETKVNDEHYLNFVGGNSERAKSDLTDGWTPVLSESDPCS